MKWSIDNTLSSIIYFLIGFSLFTAVATCNITDIVWSHLNISVDLTVISDDGIKDYASGEQVLVACPGSWLTLNGSIVAYEMLVCG